MEFLFPPFAACEKIWEMEHTCVFVWCGLLVNESGEGESKR